MNSINEQAECPICFDCIGEKNNITTECGHKFHASCLMTNASRNGFGCPCCRAVMVEVPDDDDGSDYSDDDETATLLDEDEEPFSDDALRGLRLLTNLLEGNQHDQADVVAEYQYISGEEAEHVTGPAPPREFIESTLREQGITYEQLVAWIIMDHEEYEEQSDELERFAGDLWGRMRIMISNYTPVEPEAIIEEPAPEEAPAPVEAPEAIEEFALSPIHIEDEDYDFEFAVEENDSFINFTRNIAFEDLSDLEMDLAEFMIDYTAQPKTPICVR